MRPARYHSYPKIQMRTILTADAKQMGQWVAERAAQDLRDAIDHNGFANIVVATGARARTFPGIEPVPARVTTCMITRTPDGQFQIGRPHGDPRLVVGGGGSGHAFKHAAGIGELIAQIATGEPTFVSTDFVDPNRFLR